ncbi:sugar transferase [Nostoc sp. CENA543]|uniref:heterocyst development glycosyltransferase HepC n=1 Tax=Nostoc sp. CENA543 TaxID=1869241 RepID=UPI000CA283F1|nr:heterocyst development glycosyltransferase HepC [Nostoc sp. CENA543]AUT01580.1 sugar transferase [Nostoc sp. CENA543]
MTSTIVPTLDNYYPLTSQQLESCSAHYTLQWRRGQLLVNSSKRLPQPYLPSLDNQQLLVECLKHSPVNLVSIDAKLGTNMLEFWAEACKQAHKPIFLRLADGSRLFKRTSQGAIWLQFIDRLIAGLLLLLLLPVMATLIILMQLYSPQSLFSLEWCVGEKGKLFQLIRFSTNSQKNSQLGYWLRQSGLDNLPILWNVIRGDISLIFTRCWILEDAVRISLSRSEQLSTLPIVTNSWEVKTES